MPQERNPILELDERTARLGRQWFAEVREQERADEAKAKTSQPDAETADGGLTDGLWDWLSGSGGDDGGE